MYLKKIAKVYISENSVLDMAKIPIISELGLRRKAGNAGCYFVKKEDDSSVAIRGTVMDNEGILSIRSECDGSFHPIDQGEHGNRIYVESKLYSVAFKQVS